MSFLSKLHENCDCQKMNMRITERPSLRYVWDFSDFWNIDPKTTGAHVHIGSYECPSSSTNGPPPNSPAACGVLLRAIEELSANLQETRWTKASVLYKWPRVPTAPICSPGPEPKDMCNFPFILTVWCVFSPKASGAWEPCTKWRSSDLAMEDFWGVPVTAPTEVWLLTIPEFPRHFRT